MATSPIEDGAKWLEALKGAVEGVPEEVPEGWKRVDDIAAALNFSSEWTYKLLEKLVKSGGAEKKKYRVNAGTQIRPVFHYRIIASED